MLPVSPTLAVDEGVLEEADALIHGGHHYTILVWCPCDDFVVRGVVIELWRRAGGSVKCGGGGVGAW